MLKLANPASLSMWWTCRPLARECEQMHSIRGCRPVRRSRTERWLGKDAKYRSAAWRSIGMKEDKAGCGIQWTRNNPRRPCRLPCQCPSQPGQRHRGLVRRNDDIKPSSVGRLKPGGERRRGWLCWLRWSFTLPWTLVGGAAKLSRNSNNPSVAIIGGLAAALSSFLFGHRCSFKWARFARTRLRSRFEGLLCS